MYYYFSGVLAAVESDYAVIECAGVGYKLTISSNTLGQLSGKVGEKVKLYSYYSVREDAQELYGFFTEDEKTVFSLLITVSGVGPKAAMAICSVLTPEKLGMAISTGDTRAISAANGVGKKIAERVILELKDKFAKSIVSSSSSDTDPFAEGEVENGAPSAVSDALAVLMSLGYTRAEASRALRGLSADLDCDTLIRQALNALMQ